MPTVRLRDACESPEQARMLFEVFSSYTKIADTLQLEPDLAGLAPADARPPPA
jgi:hypothetical protein